MSVEAPQLAINMYLSGPRMSGIEIGPLHQPTPIPENCTITYVDCYSKQELEDHYREEGLEGIVDVDVIDEGETLSTFGDGTQDFVIASHVIEHFPNPLLGMLNMLRVIKNTGTLILVAPDKRYSFDVLRPITTFGHVVKDYEQGPEWSRRLHAEDNSRNNIHSTATTEAEIQHFADIEMARERSSFHHHVWSAVDFVDFVMKARDYLGLKFQIEFMMHQGINIVMVLKKDDDESLLAANLGALRSTDPGLAEWIEGLDDKRDLCNRVVTSQIAYIDSTCVHDEQDPVGEAERLAEQWIAQAQSDKPFEILGFGLGFHVESLLKRLPEDGEIRLRLLDRVMFQLALRRRDLRATLSDPRLKFVPTIEPDTALHLPSITVN